MMTLAEPYKVVSGLHPRPHLIRVADPRVVLLQPRQVHPVLKAELDMSVMQLQPAPALTEIPPVRPHSALRGVFRPPPVRLEINIMRIVHPSWMLRVKQGVRMGYLLPVRVNHTSVYSLE
jgi:hypothetical protein